jgi:phosphoribosylanthranilate isomerase
MREPDNVKQVAQLGVDMMGFIFYPKSPRYASHVVARSDADRNVCRVGVFVNDSVSTMLDKIYSFSLNAVQMHGNESRELCEQLRAAKGNMKIIKAISVSTAGDIQKYKEYVGAVDYFLFDTKCKTVGGSGQQFDWQVLDEYDGDVPFLLSGGIGPEDASRILSFHHPRCVGIDLNSRFEIEPGLKD